MSADRPRSAAGFVAAVGGRAPDGRRVDERQARGRLHRLARPPLPGGALVRDLGARRGPGDGVRREGLVADPDEEDPLHFRQASLWESHDDFDRYWYSDEVSAFREEAVNYYNKPVLPVWHSLIAGE